MNKTPRILITGNMGYVGPVLVRHLRSRFPGAELVGFDSGLFGHCLTSYELPEHRLDRQIFGDVRDIDASLLEGVNGVVALAAISNDPMGNRFERQTGDINCAAAVDLAHKAAAAGVSHYVFASSCSVYGAAAGPARTETDSLNPLTAYARSKIGTEQALKQADLGGMLVTSLRFATACGMSDRLRLDLVLNDFVACALATGEITILSDGTPWRPLIDVRDMARAIEWALIREEEAGSNRLSVNAGSNDWNYQVKDLAAAVTREIDGSRYSISTDAAPDRRSYKVDFSLFRSLAPEHQPQATLASTIKALKDGLESIGFADANFRSSDRIRLNVLGKLITSGRLSEEIRWQEQSQAA